MPRLFKGPVSRLILALLALCALSPQSPNAQEVSRVELEVLDDLDVARYREIFAVQEDGKWREADRLIARLSNDMLMGHVLYQRYMHPTDYRSRYDELAAWMKQYADLPGAARIYRLAQSRRYRGGPSLRAPVPTRPRTVIRDANVDSATPATRQNLPLTRAERELRRDVLGVNSRINRYLRRGQPERAEKRLWAAGEANMLSPENFGETLGEIAGGYYFQGENEKALALARLSSAAARDIHFEGDWFGGLAAWRLGDCARAATHFERVVDAERTDSWVRSAASFWAARARLVCREPDRVNRHLEAAANYPKTFYGMIAARQLGRDITFAWDHPPLPREEFTDLKGQDGVRRALALAQVGRENWADLELRYVWLRSDPSMQPALLGLASRLNLPSTQLRGAKATRIQSVTLSDSVFYPLPDWEPEGGFSLDRALMFAFMRQESEFNALAISHAGARGLMQLMPRTASYIGRDRSLRYSKRVKLYEPSFNMALGQRYLTYLLEDQKYGGNLFLAASAYNGGPGNLAKWLRQNHFQGDPLLFIESIPLQETRIYVERVIANLWIYRMRMGQPTPSLDAVAAGDWPIYAPQDAVFSPAPSEGSG